MAKSNSNFSALFDVELDTSTIKKQLQDATKNITANIKVDVDDKSIKGIKDGMDGAKDSIDGVRASAEEATLTFQVANAIFSTTVDIITSMVDQVYELDSAMIE